MATFLSQLVGFALIIWIVTKYAVPPIRRLMAAQRETVATRGRAPVYRRAYAAGTAGSAARRCVPDATARGGALVE